MVCFGANTKGTYRTPAHSSQSRWAEQLRLIAATLVGWF
jgi:hypothetical protein